MDPQWIFRNPQKSSNDSTLIMKDVQAIHVGKYTLKTRVSPTQVLHQQLSPSSWTVAQKMEYVELPPKGTPTSAGLT